MCDKRYMITDGTRYIKFNAQDNIEITTSEALAFEFTSLKRADEFMKSPKMKKINSSPKKFQVKEIGEQNMIPVKEENNNQFKDTIMREVQSLDGTFRDFDSFRLSDYDNKHVYAGETFIEQSGMNLMEFMTLAVRVFSELGTYAENMAYMERECDLKLQDYKHYKRDPRTKMNAIQAQKLQYIEQDVERERIEYKLNKTLSALFVKDKSRLENKDMIEIINNIFNSEYRYRRINREDIEESINNRKSDKLKAV